MKEGTRVVIKPINWDEPKTGTVIVEGFKNNLVQLDNGKEVIIEDYEIRKLLEIEEKIIEHDENNISYKELLKFIIILIGAIFILINGLYLILM